MANEPTIVKEVPTPGVALTETPELQTALDATASFEDIKALLHTEADKQGVPLAKAAEVKVEAKQESKEAEKEVYYDDIVIGGRSYHFEGDSPADILRQIKAANSAHENATNPEKKTVDTAAKKGMTNDEKVALELDYRMGKIGLDEYLDKSGALDSYLEKKGVKTEQLKEIVAEKVNRKEVDAWEAATNEFLQSHGKDEWPGGDQNTKIMALKLAELGLNGIPSVESLNKAFVAMKADNLIFPVAAVETKTAESQPKKKQLSGSSVFGMVGGAGRDRGTEKSTGALPQIPDNMHPRDILELFKSTAQANGQNPDQVLYEAYQHRR